MSISHLINFLQINPDGKKAPPGWLFGEANGRNGLFPENYVEKVTEDEAKALKQESSDYSVPESSSSVKSLAAALSMQFSSGGLPGGSSASNQDSAVTSTQVPASKVSVESHFEVYLWHLTTPCWLQWQTFTLSSEVFRI